MSAAVVVLLVAFSTLTMAQVAKPPMGLGVPSTTPPGYKPQPFEPALRAIPCSQVDGIPFAVKFADSGYNFTSQPAANSLQNAIDQVLGNLTQSTAIAVPAGTYSAITINASLLNGHTLLLYSISGTDNTRIEANAMGGGNAVNITGSGPGAIQLGYVSTELASDSVPTTLNSANGAFGFHITTNGGLGVGVKINDVNTTDIRIKACRINNCANSGFRALNCDSIELSYCIIEDNTSPSHAAGVKITGCAQVSIYHNWILRNKIATLATGSRAGGGLYISTDTAATPRATDVMICGNLISRNVAHQGAGIYFGHDEPVAADLVIRNNIITSNEWRREDGISFPAEHGHAGDLGAGIALLSTIQQPDPGYALGFLIAANKIISNVATNTTPDDEDESMGGGLYLGCVITAESQLVGNSIANNIAGISGGGLWLGVYAVGGSSLIANNNSIGGNKLIQTFSAGVGSGLHIEGEHGAFPNQHSSFAGANNIIGGNAGGISGAQWHVDCVANINGDWLVPPPLASSNLNNTLSFTPNYACGGTGISTQTSANLFGPNCIVGDTNMMLADNVNDPTLILGGSPCLDTGLASVLTSFPPFYTLDYHQQVRVDNNNLDIGADEGHLFIRGDINYDGKVDYVDWWLLWDLVSRGLAGFDAADINDDGLMDVLNVTGRPSIFDDLEDLQDFIELGTAVEEPTGSPGYDPFDTSTPDTLPEYPNTQSSP